MLLSIELRGISFASCKFPLAHLTSLVLTHSNKALSPSELKRVLTTASSLRDLSLFGDIVSSGRDAWTSIQIPSLVSLTLSPGADTLFTHLCMALVMPALESLTLQHFSSESIRIFIESMRPYSPKYPRLQMLELRAVMSYDTSTTAQIIDLLERCPSITQLSLISFYPSTYIPLLAFLYCEDSVGSASAGDTHADHDDSLNTPFDIKADTAKQMSPPLVLASDSSRLAKPALLPHLQTIGIIPLNTDNIADICKLISTRKAWGRPISCLKTSSYDRIPLESFQSLREHVTLDNI